MSVRVEREIRAPGQVVQVDEFRGTLEGFIRLRTEWEALAQACGDPLFKAHGYLRLWVEHFAPHTRLRVLLGRDDHGDLAAALPLLEREGRMFGVPVYELASPTNEHSGRFDLLAADAPTAAHAFALHLCSRTDWDVLRLSDIPEGGAADELTRAMKTLGLEVGVTPGPRSPYLTLPLTVETVDRHLSKNLRSNLRRRRRRLEEKGKVTLERLTGGEPDFALKLQEAMDLEASGWKGEEGTAIRQQPETLGFYSGLAHLAADRGELSLYFLRVEGRPVAFDLGVTVSGRYLSFKHGYSEEVRECSPGQLLTHDLVRDLTRRKVRELDFMGESSPSKLEWTRQVRPHRFHFAFGRGLRSQLVRRIKFQLVPAVKKLLRKER